MTRAELESSGLLLLAAAGVVGFIVWRKGAAGAAQAAGSAVVNAAGGAASGVVGAVGASVGLPTPEQTTTDPRVARWLIDRVGYFEASKWAGALALFEGAMLPAGTGTPPPAGSAAAALSGSPSNQLGDSARQSTGWDYSSAGLTFEQASAPDGWWPYGVTP